MDVTISWEEKLVKEAKHAAVNSGQSLSAWLADLARGKLSEKQSCDADCEYALRILEEEIAMNGTPMSREEIYQERTKESK